MLVIQSRTWKTMESHEEGENFSRRFFFFFSIFFERLSQRGSEIVLLQPMATKRVLRVLTKY